ncbi:hypothetical protein FE257_004227 [Aspergillus nanangensis]|uniref:Aminotransferase class I/classII large domain-containing protein n=1 Tax=Aspergillus nanangensis TaxID=2582783 RepID=A0AAD4GW12_ASPNN|nr:hypothetical protein FE257_004227 [Aspergillus nanangensis]
MNTINPDNRIDTTTSTHQLSRRGACNAADRDVWSPREKSMGNPWSVNNPTGTVILRLAENSLLHEEIGQFVQTQIKVLPSDHPTYSTGPRGSRRLRNAAATFLTEQFRSRQGIITADNIFITAGVASAIDALAWAICNPGDGILIPRPLYNGFHVDILNRSNAQLVGVTYEGIEGFSTLDDLFRLEVNRRALEAALLRAESEGVTVRVLLVSNPHNPLGRCYPPETLMEFARFCGEKSLHFISDEIYAMSGFPNPAIPIATPFISTLALDFQGLIDPQLTHVLYGASKDFCANGLRLGLYWDILLVTACPPGCLGGHDREQTLDGNFMREKTTLMVENYTIATDFLRGHGIRYLEMDSGLFIWVDLRHLVGSDLEARNSGYKALKVTSPGASVYKQREMRIAELCIKNGVMIAPGHVYVAEEYGWFRITFTVGKQALKEGLDRLWKSLEEAAVEFGLD